MNWEAVGAFGEVVGAFTVVVTLVYLVRQIRSSAAASHVTAYHQAQQQLWSAAETVANDPTLSALVANTIGGGIDTLSPPDRIRVEFLMGSFLFGIESMMGLNQKGYIDSELWKNVFENNFRLVGSPLCREILGNRPGPLSQRLIALIVDHKSYPASAS
jgi:hypothetical protein